MIVITGAAGFIASNLVKKMNDEGFDNLVLVDDFDRPQKKYNYQGKKYLTLVNREVFFQWLDENYKHISFIFHLGARTDTTEMDENIFNKLNLEYSQLTWQKCSQYNIPLLYASSAATYGLGELGYKDDHTVVDKLKPLNPYGLSKNDFDKWVLKQESTPPFWAGLKFFNVYGPNEYHKGRMASVVFHAFHQIKNTGKMNLFRSHKDSYKDGEQKRDFIYVKDVVDVMHFLYVNQNNPGIYNIGTGKARSFLDLANATFKSMGVPAHINFVDTPADIRDKYQYFTEADMSKLRSIGYQEEFSSLENGIHDYVTSYLIQKNYQ
ncbi:MAG: ADP-glyceromanno-heptose 6-epimerase [Bacteroidota bacterium]